MLQPPNVSSQSLSPLRLCHPAGENDFANAYAVSFFPIEPYTHIIPPLGVDFSVDFDDDAPQVEIHYEITCLCSQTV